MHRWVDGGWKADLKVPGLILIVVINIIVKIIENKASRLIPPPNGPSHNMGPAYKSCHNLVSVKTSSGHWCELCRCWKSNQRLIIYSVNSCFWNVFRRGLRINTKHKHVDNLFSIAEFDVFTYACGMLPLVCQLMRLLKQLPCFQKSACFSHVSVVSCDCTCYRDFHTAYYEPHVAVGILGCG
jgi:hypothetical protein